MLPTPAPGVAESSAWRTACYRLGGFPGYVPDEYPWHSDDWRRPACLFPIDAFKRHALQPTATPEKEGGAYVKDGYFIMAIFGNSDVFGWTAAASAALEEGIDLTASGAKAVGRKVATVVEEVAEATGVDDGLLGVLAKLLGLPRPLIVLVLVVALWAVARQFGLVPPLRKLVR
jgi:hypothetical protein